MSWKTKTRQRKDAIAAFKRLGPSGLTEYLALLYTRSKWTKTRKDLAVNDVVILADESIPRHSWKLARVIHIHTNGLHVRKATVKRSDGKILIKDRTKTVKLELDNINKNDNNG